MGIASSSFSSLQDTGKASLKKSYSDAFKAFCNVARCVFRINRDFSAKLNQNQAVEDPFDATQFQQVRVSARTRCSYTKWRKRRYSILFGRPIILEISILRYFELLGETWPSKWAATLQVTCLERKGAERMAGAHAPAMHSSAACRRFGADLARIKFVEFRWYDGQSIPQPGWYNKTRAETADGTQCFEGSRHSDSWICFTRISKSLAFHCPGDQILQRRMICSEMILVPGFFYHIAQNSPHKKT